MLLFPLRRLGPIGALVAFVTALVVTIGVLVLVSVTAPRAHAQRTLGDTVSFLYLKGTDTVATERVVRTAVGFAGSLTVKGQARMEWRQHIGANLEVGAFDLDAYGPNTPPDAKPLQRVTLRVVNDTGYMDIHAPDGTTTTPQRLKVNAGAQWLLNSSLLHSAILAGMAQQQQKAMVPIVLVQGGQQLPLEFRSIGDTLVVTLAGGELRYVQDDRGITEATFAAQGLRLRRVSTTELSRAAAPPSYAAPAGAPYTATDVRITTPKGHALAATFTRPTGSAKVPVVITITGSGQQDRDEAISIVNGFRPFRQIADTLGRRGVAVLRWDDEGVGGSGGDVLNATSEDFANDVRAIITWLRARPDVDGDRIGIVGHSEGGMIAPMVAASDPKIRAIALMAGPAYNGHRILRYQFSGAMGSTAGVMRPPVDSAQNAGEEGAHKMITSSPWSRYFAAYEPLPTARKVRQPVLILQGETDHQITPEQADTLALAFRAGGNRDVTVRKLPNTNHLFLDDPDGRGSGYATLKHTNLSPIVLGALADWFVLKLK